MRSLSGDTFTVTGTHTRREVPRPSVIFPVVNRTTQDSVTKSRDKESVHNHNYLQEPFFFFFVVRLQFVRVFRTLDVMRRACVKYNF